jgi:phosphoribosyl 1,2-cyclic phosphodiesterase
MINVISSGSKGNAVLYHNSILIDIGVSFTNLEKIVYNIQLVVLSHEHTDHINLSTLNKLLDLRPSVRILLPDHMIEYKELINSKNIDLCYKDSVMDYGFFTIIPEFLRHDVPNFGYHIFYKYHKIFHATDCSDLEGIVAKKYDILAIEHNYDEEQIEDVIREKIEKGKFVYENRAYNTHLSEQQAREFILKNAGENTKVVRLHESENY